MIYGNNSHAPVKVLQIVTSIGYITQYPKQYATQIVCLFKDHNPTMTCIFIYLSASYRPTAPAAAAKPANAPRPPGTGFFVAKPPAPKPVVVAPKPSLKPKAVSDDDEDDKPKGGFFGLFVGAPKK